MLKRLFVISVCVSIGIFCANLAFSQDDPSTTDPAKIENPSDEGKTELKDEIKTEEVKKAEPVKTETATGGQQTIIAANAKAYTDGKTIFVNSKVQFKLTSTDDLSIDRIEYKIDEGAVATYQNPFAIEPEGYHTIKYYGIDKAGNKEPDKTYNVAVDNTGPAIVVSTSSPVKKIGDKVYYQKNVLFNVNTNDALSGVNKIEYSTDGTNYQEYAAPFAIPAKGDINLKIKATDNVNNVTEQFAFRVVDDSGNEIEFKDAVVKLVTDETAPAVEIKPDKEMKKIENQNVASTDVKYTVTATDAESGVAVIFYRIDGKGDFIPYKNEIQFMNNGKHQIDAKAVDKAGNVSNITTFTVYVDILPPNSTIETLDK
jgi:hypothetical protein